MSMNQALDAWVRSVAALTQPESIHLCDGSDDEYQALLAAMVDSGTLEPLNPDSHPNSYLHRSDPSDVARVEHLTFVCTEAEADAGPNNNWLSPDKARARMRSLFAGCMRGRTLYVVPYLMGPLDSPYARFGVEITDSPYVVANMRIMTRMGAEALKRAPTTGPFVRGLHSTGTLDPNQRYIMHFPETLEIMSFGSGYGGNALLGKKCHALRLASHQGRREGWLAEHMLILGLESPAGETHYVAAAFPSACGKTNMAMLVPPAQYQGWKVWTVGDDIAWLHKGEDGRVYAVNPEAGFFGVAPGTGRHTNPVCLDTLGEDTIYTNVALTEDNTPWWEGLDGPRPERLTDWQGRPHDPANGPAAHPNARFTVSAKRCPSYTEAAEAPLGVPLSAIIFGGRRAKLAPLVYEARDWAHGVFVGASVASETTAAATGQVGVVRRDPMAMKPFCGYNFADYWQHWLDFGASIEPAKRPQVFHVNWFRKGDDGRFLWPGFGENLRVLEWIIGRCRGEAEAVDTAIGAMPTLDGIRREGLSLTDEALAELLSVDGDAWATEADGLDAYFDEYGERLPEAFLRTLAELRVRLAADRDELRKGEGRSAA